MTAHPLFSLSSARFSLSSARLSLSHQHDFLSLISTTFSLSSARLFFSLSHQHDFFKIKNAKKKYLETKIKNLKKDFQNNTAEILRTERELNKVADDEMREEVLRMRNFEYLNNEKITPYFLSLAKKPQHSEDLLNVCDVNGEPFDNALARDAYIREYFADTYKKVPEPEHRMTIDQFLGETANHPDVLASKLSNEEREELEKNVSIAEFDKALEKAKLNTSPGIDNISNRFIKHFWHIFRMPLFEYANACYETGILTENFRCAKIRLIPKKGDATQLKTGAQSVF